MLFHMILENHLIQILLFQEQDRLQLNLLDPLRCGVIACALGATPDIPIYRHFSNTLMFDSVNRAAPGATNIFLTDRSPAKLFAPTSANNAIILE